MLKFALMTFFLLFNFGGGGGRPLAPPPGHAPESLVYIKKNSRQRFNIHQLVGNYVECRITVFTNFSNSLFYCNHCLRATV